MTDTETPRPLVVLARLMQVAERLEGEIADDLARSCEIEHPEALGSSDVEQLVACGSLAVAFLEQTIVSLRALKTEVAHSTGGLMTEKERAEPWGIVRRESDSSWSGWDNEGLIRALAPKIGASVGLEPNEVRAVIEALPARPDWRPGAIRDEWKEDPEEFASHPKGRRIIRTSRTDKLAAVASELTGADG